MNEELGSYYSTLQGDILGWQCLKVFDRYAMGAKSKLVVQDPEGTSLFYCYIEGEGIG